MFEIFCKIKYGIGSGLHPMKRRLAILILLRLGDRTLGPIKIVSLCFIYLKISYKKNQKLEDD
jgi:hypothetical protein